MSLNYSDETSRGVYGSTHLKWKGTTSVYALLAKVFAENKTAGEPEVARKFGLAVLRGEEDLIMELATYFTRNNWKSLTDGEDAEKMRARAEAQAVAATASGETVTSEPEAPPAKPSRAYVPRKPVDPAEREAKASAVVDAIKQVALMDLMMPNGKKARDCRGTELVKFGGKWAKIGRQAGRKIMGTVFDEDGLRKIMYGTK